MGASGPAVIGPVASAFACAMALALVGGGLGAPVGGGARGPVGAGVRYAANASSAAVANFTSAIDRLVELVGLAGSGILALVWARVALSWFSNDVTKKVQAKDRARDALVGTLLFVAAVTGLVWGLAHWVVTGA